MNLVRNIDGDCLYGELTSRGLGNWYLSETIQDPGFFQREDLRPHLAATTAVLGLNLVGLGLIAIDGPLPFGDALGVAVLAVPDVMVYGVVYSMFD